MRTQYYTASSLDGFIATEDHSLEWLFPLGDINDTNYPQFIEQVGALAMGASTYEWMLRNIVKPGAGGDAPWPYAQPCWVFTHRALPAVAGADIRFVQGDVQPVHAQMRQAAAGSGSTAGTGGTGGTGGKNLWLVGGGELVGQFFDAGLLDEIIVQVGSVTLGAGKPLLPRRITQPSLTLTSVRQCGTGFAELRYAVPAPRAASPRG